MRGFGVAKIILCLRKLLSVVSHVEDAKEKGRRVVLGLPELPQHLKMLLLKQQTQAVNDRIPAEGRRHLLVQP